MLKNYLKIAVRSLLRHKEYTIINVLGLAVGITCCLLIMMFVRSELSYDAFHSKSGRLYRIWQREQYAGKTFDNVITPLPASEAVRGNFPEVESASRVFAFNPIVKAGQHTFTDAVDMVDPAFFGMFDFKLVDGDPARPFPDDNSIVITPAAARRYFGNSDAVGKNLQLILNEDTVLFTVKAMVSEAPEASSIKYQMLIPFANAKHLFRPGMFHNWFNIFTESYVLLKPGAAAATLEHKFPAMMKQQLGEDFGKEKFDLHLQPIRDIHLNNSLPAGNEPVSDPKYAYVLATIGFLILIVACINFVTLSVGQSTRRALEVGVRKALGAERKQLIWQFLGEALLVVLVAVALGLCLTALLLQPFDVIVRKELSMRFDAVFALFCLGIVALIALISGIYPSFILSGFAPIEVLKGKLTIREGKSRIRQGLVVGQFVTSIVMIIGTLVIGQQMHYLQTKDLGFRKDQLVVVETNKSRKEGIPLAMLFRTELLKHPQVADASVSVFSLAQSPWLLLSYENDQKQIRSFQYNCIDAAFVPTMGMKILQGRNFEPGNSADFAGTALVNETFVKAYNIKDPIGKKLPGPFPQQIIGIVRDFNFESLHTPIKPLVLSCNPDSLVRHASDVSMTAAPQPRISVLLKAGNLSDNIKMLKNAWASVAPTQDFDFHFLDERIALQYEQDQRTNTIVQIASGLSIFIACMGLFGLAALSVLKRVKEIGIRKVLGASVASIVRLLAKDFVMLVLIASVIAAPIAWWATNKWLEDFTYHVPVHWWVFVLAGLGALVIALVTLSFQTIKAALANPVKNLRTE